MKILITGGSGCLGSNLVEYYLPKGHEVYVIDNFATGKREVLPKIKGLKVVEGDISNIEVVKRCFSDFNPTHVIHSAASYKNPDNWIEDTHTNVIGTINIAKVALSSSVEKIINFQTALCYGRPLRLPISIDHQIKPFTSYGISKTAGEAFLMHSGLPVVSLRLANICAPRLSIGPIPTFYQRLKAGQECFCSDSVRDFLDIQDFFSLMDIILKKETALGVFNVSTGLGYSILDVFKTVAEYLKIDIPVTPQIKPVGADDVQQVILDPSYTEKVFGWKAKICFEDTIKNQLRWYDEFGINDIYSHLVKSS